MFHAQQKNFSSFLSALTWRKKNLKMREWRWRGFNIQSSVDSDNVIFTASRGIIGKCVTAGRSWERRRRKKKKKILIMWWWWFDQSSFCDSIWDPSGMRESNAGRKRYKDTAADGQSADQGIIIMMMIFCRCSQEKKEREVQQEWIRTEITPKIKSSLSEVFEHWACIALEFFRCQVSSEREREREKKTVLELF